MEEKILREVIREVLIEMDTTLKHSLYDKSDGRVAFNSEFIKSAIFQGRELGCYFQSNNEKYRMPTTKARIILPLALGYLSNGKLTLRAWHVTGQSEKEALRTGVRSAEIDGVWRLMNQENFKSVWDTGRYFQEAPPGYNPNDKQMVRIVAAFNPNTARAEQEKLMQQKQQEPETGDIEMEKEA